MEKILLPVDGSMNALAAVREVIDEYMRNQSAEVVLFNVQPKLSRHVARFVPGRERANWHAEQAELAMKPAKDLLNRWGVPYKSCFALGERAAVIADFAQENHCTRIVIGTARKNSLTRLFENSVTAALLERARVPVQIVVGSEASRLERFGIPAGVGAALAAAFIAAD